MECAGIKLLTVADVFLLRSNFPFVKPDLHVLVSCSLVQVSADKNRTLSTHDQQRDLAYSIVREGSSSIMRRTRLLGRDAAEALKERVRSFGYELLWCLVSCFRVMCKSWHNSVSPAGRPSQSQQDSLIFSATCIQGIAADVEGVSLQGLQLHSTSFEALSRMPKLRILILDDVKTNVLLSGFKLPRLAMLSWRGARGRSLPFALRTIQTAAVLDIWRSSELERLPSNMQAWNPCYYLNYATPASRETVALSLTLMRTLAPLDGSCCPPQLCNQHHAPLTQKRLSLLADLLVCTSPSGHESSPIARHLTFSDP